MVMAYHSPISNVLVESVGVPQGAPGFGTPLNGTATSMLGYDGIAALINVPTIVATGTWQAYRTAGRRRRLHPECLDGGGCHYGRAGAVPRREHDHGLLLDRGIPPDAALRSSGHQPTGRQRHGERGDVPLQAHRPHASVCTRRDWHDQPRGRTRGLADP